MIDLKKYPNEVILSCIHDIAYNKGFYFYPSYFGTERDRFNDKFYTMLQNVFNPEIYEVYKEKVTKLKRDYTQNKKEFETQYNHGLITLENLMAEVGELNKRLEDSIQDIEEEYAKHLRIKRVLVAQLKQFDMSEFNKNKPIVQIKDKGSTKNVFVVTKDYITHINVYHETAYYYCPEFKDKFDKLLGKTKSAEKAEPEKTK